MAEPLISVLTPTYNRAPDLRGCVQSVLSQSFREFEWLIHDDGSTDDTLAFLKSIGDPRVGVHSGPHIGGGGLADMYNKLLPFISPSSRWIAFIDSDDLWPEGKLERQFAAAERSGAAVVHGPVWQFGGASGSKVLVSPHHDEAVLRNEDGAAVAEALSALMFPMYNGASFWKRDALEKVGGFVQVGPGLIDYGTLLRIGLLGKFEWMPEPLYYWRRHAGQTSQEKVSEQLEANRRFGDAFMVEHASELAKLGIEERSIRARQAVSFEKQRRLAALWRAQGLLDAEAWPEAKAQFSSYLAEQFGRGGWRQAPFWALGVLGWISVALRTNLSRTVLNFRERLRSKGSR